MAVVKCIQTDEQRLKLFINANDRIALMIYDHDNIMAGAVIELEPEDIRELVRQCKAILKQV